METTPSPGQGWKCFGYGRYLRIYKAFEQDNMIIVPQRLLQKVLGFLLFKRYGLQNYKNLHK